MTKQGAVIAEIRQLCCLGLGGQVVMPALLRLLRAWVPSHTLLFAWSDDEGRPSNLCVDSSATIPISEIYIAEFCNKRERDVVFGFTDLLKTGPVVENFSRYGKALAESYLYDAIFRPLYIHHAMRVVVREGNRPCGMLFLHREPKESAFSAADEARMMQVVPYIAHALHPPSTAPSNYVDSGDHGLIVMDALGGVRYTDRRARHLLYLAARPRVAPDTIGRPDDAAILERVVQLGRRLSEVFQERSPAPPVWYHQNSWGRFVFRAYWLGPEKADGEPLIGVTVEYWVPLPIKVLQSMTGLPLSVRQKELCLLLAQDVPRGAIAARMRVSVNTVVDYTRAVYDKLGVSSRSALVNRLIANPAGTPLAPFE